MTKIYFDAWATHSDMLESWLDYGWDYENREQRRAEIMPKGFPTPEEVVFASYGNEQAYSGDAIVLFERGGDLWINTAGHCSCNGLEGQWSPERTTWAALAAMKKFPEDETYAEHSKEARAAFRALVASKLTHDDRSPK